MVGFDLFRTLGIRASTLKGFSNVLSSFGISMLVCNGELIVDNVRGIRLRGSIKCS